MILNLLKDDGEVSQSSPPVTGNLVAVLVSAFSTGSNEMHVYVGLEGVDESTSFVSIVVPPMEAAASSLSNPVVAFVPLPFPIRIDNRKLQVACPDNAGWARVTLYLK